MQQQPEEHETKASQAWKTLAYYSATFSKAERNYTVEDRELLAIVMSLLEWRQYLLGAPEFEIWTDHKNLQFFKEPHKINRRQARWVTEVLSQFHFTLHHLPGIRNSRADALSRSFGEGTKGDNTDVTVLPEHMFRAAITTPNNGYSNLCTALGKLFEALAILPKNDSHRFQEITNEMEITKEHMTRVLSEVTPEVDSDVRRRILLAEDHEPEILKLTDVEKDSEGFIIRHDLVYVPPSLREEIMSLHHDHPLAGHPGRWRTQENIARQYWWLDIASDIKRYIDGCAQCQQVNPIRQKGGNTLNPMPIAKTP